jgi:hypothetical protein
LADAFEQGSPLGFVVKNGSKIRAATSGLIPIPVSLTTNST